MSPHFVCHDCGRVSLCEPQNKICPSCDSTKGHIISDEEFKEYRKTGAVKPIDPTTGKPFKK
jgi:Zn finger protein HypA/HybF involved in hydrogenase expression